MQMDPDDQRLIERTLEGDSRAFETLVHRYCNMVYMIAYSRLGEHEAAEDLTQEVFLRAFLNMDQYDRVRKFSPWIAQITRNLATDWYRRNQRRSQVVFMLPIDQLGGEEDVRDETAEAAWERLEKEERDRQLHQAMMRLPDEQRELVLLRFSQEMNNKQIADQLGMHPTTVARQMGRALDRLKAQLAGAVESFEGFGERPVRAEARCSAMLGVVAALSPAAKASLAKAVGGVAPAVFAAAGGGG